LAEIAERTNRRVTQQGTRLDAHERQLAGLRQVAGTVVGHTGDISRIDERLIEINTSLEHASGRAEMAATAAIGAHDRLDNHENRLDGLENRLDGNFPWIIWGGIVAGGFLLSALFWRLVMYGGNWHPWLEDRGGSEYWQRQHPGLLNFHYWVVVVSTTLLVAGIAVLFMRNGDDNQAENNDDDDDNQPVAVTTPVNPTTAPVEAPEPPPAIDQPTSVFGPDQQPALR
jgi:hypothetical protein